MKSSVYVLKNDETRNYHLEEIKQNDLMSEKYKKMFDYLNYFENLLIFVWAVTIVFQLLHLLH